MKWKALLETISKMSEEELNTEAVIHIPGVDTVDPVCVAYVPDFEPLTGSHIGLQPGQPILTLAYD